MYITAGTTSARVHVVGRWAFVGSVLVGSAMGFAGYRPWACLTVFWLLGWTVWMFSALIRRQRRIPGNWAHVSLLGVAVIFAGHLAMYFVVDRSRWSVSTMDGELDASMLFHAALLSLGVFLAQSYLGDADHRRLIRLCGAAISLGAATAILCPLTSGARDAHVIVFLAGLLVFAAPRWTNRPREGLWSPTARASLLLGAAVCAAMMLGLTILWWNVPGSDVWRTPRGLFGWGELAFSLVSGSSSGSAVLATATGFAGWAVFVLGLSAALLRALLRGRWSRTEFFWLLATALSTLALLAPGGFFLPLTAVAFVVTWGLLPRICGLPVRGVSGWWMVGAMLVVAVLLGLTRKVGLMVTISDVFERSDKHTHGIFGFLLAVTAAWRLGAGRTWLGAVGIAAAALLGGLGEVAQRVVGLGRAFEMADWGAHVLGASLATIGLTLCFLARQAEPVGIGKYATRWEKTLGRGTGGVLLILVFLATTGWMGLSVWRTAEQWNRKRPWFVVSDGVEALGKNVYYLRGAMAPPSPMSVKYLMTVSREGIAGVWSPPSGERLAAKVLGRGAGLHRQSVLGQPFGELSAQRPQEGRFLLIERGTPVLAVDAALALSDTGKNLRAVLAALKREGAVVLFDGSPAREHWRRRPILHMQYPDVPCVAATASWNATDVLVQIRAGTGSRLTVLTADPNLAGAASHRLGNGAEVHWIRLENAARTTDRRVKTHAGWDEFLKSRPAK